MAKLKRKKCDLIIANNVSLETKVMNGEMNSALYLCNNSSCLAIYDTMKKVDLSKKILTDIIHPILHKKW